MFNYRSDHILFNADRLSSALLCYAFTVRGLGFTFGVLKPQGSPLMLLVDIFNVPALPDVI